MTIKDIIKRPITIICGHYGTGKTNIAVNAAIDCGKSGKSISIVDLDIVNPYFRTADNANYLTQLGVDTIIPQFANTNVDIPSLPEGSKSIINSGAAVIIDVGGDSDGAIVLRADSAAYKRNGYDMFFVYNLNRPALLYLKDDVAMLISM